MTAGRVLADLREMPADPLIPGLPVVLHPDAVQEIAVRAVGQTELEVTGAAIDYLRYKPGTNCIVAYTLDWHHGPAGRSDKARLYAKAFTGDDFVQAELKVGGGHRLDAQPFPPVYADHETSTVIYFYPNDAELDGLRLIAEPKKIQRTLYEHIPYLPSGEWRISDRRLKLTTVRYKPEKRAVLRIDTRATHRTSGERRPLSVFLRTYADGRGARVHAIMESLHRQLSGQDKVCTPAPRGYIALRNTLLMDGVAGTPLADRLAGEERDRALDQAATALARLHSAAVEAAPPCGTESLLEEAESTCAFLGRLVPDLAGELGELSARLKSAASRTAVCARTGFVHGDFHQGQLLLDGESTALLDFDRSYAGDVVADVGNFGAHMHLLERQGRIVDGAGAFARFTAAYERQAGLRLDDQHLKFWQTFGLLQLAVRPFRTLEPGWAGTIRATVSDCLELAP
jgi:aminoglycoside phosphotransferase (APT) family kinase protein